MRLMIAHRPGKKRPFKYWCFCGNHGRKYIRCLVCDADLQRNKVDQTANRCWRNIFRSEYLYLIPLWRLLRFASMAGKIYDREGFHRIRSIVRQHYGEAAEARVLRLRSVQRMHARPPLIVITEDRP